VLKCVLLGRTGLEVSRLSVGTVELGMNYGIRVPGEFGSPPAPQAIRLVRAAVRAGINLFDTAPVYGVSETILGKALVGEQSCYVATKVSFPRDDWTACGASGREQDIMNSLQRSLRKLQREVLDIVQIHNATRATFENGVLPRTVQLAKEQGLVGFVGASVYSEDDALAAIGSEIVDVLQIPFSILDQRPVAKVLPAAKAANVGIIGRSVLLKGALTPKALHLLADLVPLREAADRVRRAFDVSWEELPRTAIRYCLGVPGLHTLLLGIRTEAELDDALAAVEEGPLPEADMASTQGLGLDDERLLNPSHWERQ